VSLPAWLRRPGTLGLTIGVLAVPLILGSGAAGVLVALTALCAYPLLVVPMTLAGPSWWRAALVSTLVWIVVFSVVVGTADSMRHLGDDSMIFLLPFTMYPLALLIAGLVRIERKVRGRPLESGPRIAAVIGGVACAALVGVPLALNLLPFAVERITGNSPPNTVSTAEAEVIGAATGTFTARLGRGAESFRVTPETRFGFLGSGRRPADMPAGPAWLKAGQRVSLEYAYRGGQAEARYVGIVIEDSGCMGDPKWAAAQQETDASAKGVPSLAGTHWYGWNGTLFEFLDGGRLAYTDPGVNPRRTKAAWRQGGAAVLIEVNDCYGEYEARIDGDEMKGLFTNRMGAREPWTARRRRVAEQR
jgi:hypothetical protein